MTTSNPHALRQQRDALYKELKAHGKVGAAVALKMRYALGHKPGSRERVLAETQELLASITLHHQQTA